MRRRCVAEQAARLVVEAAAKRGRDDLRTGGAGDADDGAVVAEGLDAVTRAAVGARRPRGAVEGGGAERDARRAEEDARREGGEAPHPRAESAVRRGEEDGVEVERRASSRADGGPRRAAAEVPEVLAAQRSAREGKASTSTSDALGGGELDGHGLNVARPRRSRGDGIGDRGERPAPLLPAAPRSCSGRRAPGSGYTLVDACVQRRPTMRLDPPRRRGGGRRRPRGRRARLATTTPARCPWFLGVRSWTGAPRRHAARSTVRGPVC